MTSGSRELLDKRNQKKCPAQNSLPKGITKRYTALNSLPKGITKIHSPEFLAKRNLKSHIHKPAAQTQKPCKKDSSTPPSLCTAQLNPTAQGFTVSTPGAIPPVENILHEQNKHNFYQTIVISNTSIHVSMVLFPAKFVVSSFCGMALVSFSFFERHNLLTKGARLPTNLLPKEAKPLQTSSVLKTLVCSCWDGVAG